MTGATASSQVSPSQRSAHPPNIISVHVLASYTHAVSSLCRPPNAVMPRKSKEVVSVCCHSTEVFLIMLCHTLPVSGLFSLEYAHSIARVKNKPLKVA